MLLAEVCLFDMNWVNHESEILFSFVDIQGITFRSFLGCKKDEKLLKHGLWSMNLVSIKKKCQVSNLK